MAGETVVGALRYDFTADTSGLKSGLAQTQDALKKATDGVKDAAKNFDAMGKEAVDAIKKIAPDLSKAQDAFDKLGATAKVNAESIVSDFKKVGETVKRATDEIVKPARPSSTQPPAPPPKPPVPAKNDNDLVLAGFDRFNKSKYDIVAGLSAAAKKAGDDFNEFGGKAAHGVGLAKHEMLNLTRQLNDIGVSLAGGMSPFMVLTQQGGQIADIFQQSGASIGRVAAQIAAGIARVVFSLKGIGLSATAIFGGIEVAAMAAKDKLADLAEQAKKAAVTPETLLGAQVKGAKVGLSNEDITGGLQNAAKEFENFKRNTGSVVDSVKEIDKSFLKTLDNTRSFGGWLDAIANKIRSLPATQARDLAESIFPADKASKFIDLIKQGEFSIASFQRAAASAGGDFSQIADNAADLRVKLAAADEEVNSRLLVSLAKLPTPIGTVASLWTDIKGKIADIVPVIGDIMGAINDALSKLREAFDFLKTNISDVASAVRSDLVDALSLLADAMEPFKSAWEWVIEKINKAIEGAKILIGLYRSVMQQADNLIAGEDLAAKKLKGPTPLMAGGFVPGDAPKSQFKPSEMFLSTLGELKGPRTGDTRATYQAAQDANKEKSKKSDTDQVKTYIESLKEAASTAQAEADNWKLGNVEREKAIALAKGEAMAKKEGRSLSEAERNEILNLAGLKEQSKQKTDEMKRAQDQLNDAMRQFGDLATNALDSLLVKGQKATEVLRNLLSQLASAALKGLLTGEGMFGNMLGMTAPKEGGLGGLLGKALSFLPKFAGGGSLGAGRWGIAGEAGPELVKGPAHITPFGKMGGNQRAKVTVHNYGGEKVQTRQMSDGEILVIVGNMIQSNNKRVPGLVADAQRRSI